jgi:hypothetical protein
VIRLERSSGELMLAPVQLLSATRQNLWRLTFIRMLVLAAQAGSVGFAYLFNLLPLPLVSAQHHPWVFHAVVRVYRNPVAHHLAGD